MSTPPRPLDVSDIVRKIEEASGLRCGFPTQSDYSRFNHVVALDGLCRDHLGHDRFCTAYRIARGEAACIAPRAFIVKAIRDQRHLVTGYEFGFQDADAASLFIATITAELNEVVVARFRRGAN